MGLAVQVLPLNNPLRIAEEVATVDHISRGRFDFGIGRSGFPRVYDIYGVDYAESQARFHEALEVILEAWKGEPFDYAGEFYRFTNAVVAPRPYQLPHPPLRMAATTEETFPRVGRMGLPIFVGVRGLDIPDLQRCLRAYREAWREAGHPGHGDVCLRVPVYASDTEKGALEERARASRTTSRGSPTSRRTRWGARARGRLQVDPRRHQQWTGRHRQACPDQRIRRVADR